MRLLFFSRITFIIITIAVITTTFEIMNIINDRPVSPHINATSINHKIACQNAQINPPIIDALIKLYFLFSSSLKYHLQPNSSPSGPAIRHNRIANGSEYPDKLKKDPIGWLLVIDSTKIGMIELNMMAKAPISIKSILSFSLKKLLI